MGAAFGQILGTIDSWLGRSFLLARFFPWLLFALANLLVASNEFRPVRDFALALYRGGGSADRIIDLAMALGVVAVAAFTLSPAVRVVTRLLEGEGLWRWLSEPLLLYRARQREERSDRWLELFRRRAKLEDVDVIGQRLARARAAGEELQAITDDKAIEAAARAIEELDALRYLSRPIDAARLGRAVALLAAALRRNCADRVDLKPGCAARDYEHCENLDELHRRLTERIAPYAIDLAQVQERLAIAAHDGLFGKAELAPTRLGNDVAALRSYCDTRYGFDFDFFWPRLQVALKDDKILAALGSARVQVEFSILCLTLSGLFVCAWLPLLAICGRSLWSLALVAAGGPLMLAIWLWMVHESFAAYAELVRSAIDLGRFDLLSALRRPLPETADEERDVWEGLARRLILDERDVAGVLQHAPP